MLKKRTGSFVLPESQIDTWNLWTIALDIRISVIEKKLIANFILFYNLMINYSGTPGCLKAFGVTLANRKRSALSQTILDIVALRISCNCSANKKVIYKPTAVRDN